VVAVYLDLKCVCLYVSQAGTEGGCVVLFEVTSDGIAYSRSFTNLGGKHFIAHSLSSIEFFYYYTCRVDTLKEL